MVEGIGIHVYLEVFARGTCYRPTLIFPDFSLLFLIFLSDFRI
jgi:hypothetical protein